MKLTGFADSVYTRVVQMGLAEAGIEYDYVEVNPFDPDETGLDALHPFRRVPVLEWDGFTVYETQAQLDLIATHCSALSPDGLRAKVRMRQVMGIIDSYGYQPMVRDVFGAAVYAPREGRPADTVRISNGMAEAQVVLAALEQIAAEGLVLEGTRITLADCYLAPMIDYFVAYAPAHEMVSRHMSLNNWYQSLHKRLSLSATRPVWLETLP